jgi:predicted HTH transcriptional regulator
VPLLKYIFFNTGKSLVSDDVLVEGGKSQSRNPLISRALRLIGFAELGGSGLREIHRAWRKVKRRPPKVQSNEDANTFTLTLDWRLIEEICDEFWKKKLGVHISKEEATILSLAADRTGVTLNDIASALGVIVEDAEENVQKLIGNQLLDEKNGKYFIKKHLNALAQKAKKSTES